MAWETAPLQYSRVFRCHVTGLELGREATVASRQRSLNEPVPASTSFVRGDAEMPPFRSGAFDAVIIECATSLFVDKPAAIAEVRRLLRPGGVIGLSDVTVEPGSLPPELDSTVGMMLCLTDALPVAGYPALLEAAGFDTVECSDLSNEVLSLLNELRGKLSLWRGLADAATASSATDLTDIAPGLLERVEKLVLQGQIGYWLYVAPPGRVNPKSSAVLSCLAGFLKRAKHV